LILCNIPLVLQAAIFDCGSFDHAAVQNTFNTQRHLISRRTMRVLRGDAFGIWRAELQREARHLIQALAPAFGSSRDSPIWGTSIGDEINAVESMAEATRSNQALRTCVEKGPVCR
jgi:hypothetical protein